MNEISNRIELIIKLLDKEDILLQGVVSRLFNQDILDVKWLDSILNTPEGIDKLESFAGKFCRMQDTFVDKLTPLFLKVSGEITSTAINNLHKLEKIGIVCNTDDWITMRLLRNKLVHEYVDDTQELLNYLLLAKHSAQELHDSLKTIKEHIE